MAERQANMSTTPKNRPSAVPKLMMGVVLLGTAVYILLGSWNLYRQGAPGAPRLPLLSGGTIAAYAPPDVRVHTRVGYAFSTRHGQRTSQIVEVTAETERSTPFLLVLELFADARLIIGSASPTNISGMFMKEPISLSYATGPNDGSWGFPSQLFVATVSTSLAGKGRAWIGAISGPASASIYSTENARTVVSTAIVFSPMKCEQLRMISVLAGDSWEKGIKPNCNPSKDDTEIKQIEVRADDGNRRVDYVAPAPSDSGSFLWTSTGARLRASAIAKSWLM